MRVACMGELLIDFVALESGVTVGEASGFEKKPGGAPANVAVAVKRLGQESSFLGQVGDDPFGHYLSGVLNEEGVNVDGLRFSDEARTMLAFVSNRADGERSFNFYRHPSADMLMTPNHINTDVLDDCDMFHFGSITMISSPAKEATLAAAEYAKNAGKIISYDPNLRAALWESMEAAKEGMRLGLDYAHIIKVSDEEVNTILLDGEELTDWFDKFPQLQVIAFTFGRNGCELLTRKGGKFRHYGYAVESVDTTGAGDSFVAGLQVGILEQLQARGMDTDLSDLEYKDILRLANGTGAMATMKKGAIPSIPTREQVSAFLEALER